MYITGGKTLGVKLAEQISGLYKEIKEYNKNKKSNIDSPSTSSNQGEFTSRFVFYLNFKTFYLIYTKNIL